MSLSLGEMELLTRLVVKTVKKVWEDNFKEPYSDAKAAADRIAIGGITAEILEHYFEEGLPKDLKKE